MCLSLLAFKKTTNNIFPALMRNLGLLWQVLNMPHAQLQTAAA